MGKYLMAVTRSAKWLLTNARKATFSRARTIQPAPKWVHGILHRRSVVLWTVESQNFYSMAVLPIKQLPIRVWCVTRVFPDMFSTAPVLDNVAAAACGAEHLLAVSQQHAPHRPLFLWDRRLATDLGHLETKAATLVGQDTL